MTIHFGTGRLSMRVGGQWVDIGVIKDVKYSLTPLDLKDVYVLPERTGYPWDSTTMSDFSVPVVRIGKVEKHPNADTLSVTQVQGVPVIIKTGDFQEGDLAVYVPVDGVVPATVPGTEFLDKTKRRVKAIRLRGIYSEGLLLPLSALGTVTHAEVGGDAAGLLGITKYEEPIPVHMSGRMAAPLLGAPVYDVESGRKFSDVFEPGEDVVITEKLHGTSFRACYDPERGFMVGSRNNWWHEAPGNLYWEAARQYDLENKLKAFPKLVIYGEVYGQVQDMKYDSKPGQRWLRIFDVYDGDKRLWVGWPWVAEFLRCNGLDSVPVLMEGPFNLAAIEAMSDGKSAVASHFREGVVVKPVFTRHDPRIGRVILKWVGQTYKLRQGGTELH